MNQLKVKSTSNPKSVAGAVTGMLKDGAEKLEIIAVGAGAINQAVKAVAIARGNLTPSGINVALIPSFSDIEIEGNERTAIRFEVVRR